MISEDVIQRVKDENDIVEVISEDVKLKRAGRNYFGLCPFHHEKTPSFSVSQDKQIYKCFGCGEVGNVITYTMKTKNLSFPEAIKLLADRVNIDIDIDGKGNEKNTFKNKMYKINVDAARYFFGNLIKNKKAVNYFLNRGVTGKTIKRFGLGYAKDNWDGTLSYLKNKGYKEQDILEAGLAVRGRNNSCYDRFRNRVIFPVFDYKGRVIGFGGRVLDDSKPKYLNSPETYVFKKGTNLYGLNYAIKQRTRNLIIVEGYMDCITLHQYGIENVVASLGTALTMNQGRLLKRYADRVIISYDADVAGQAATMRGLQILKEVGLEVRILTVPEGKDPDEFVRNNGKEAYLELVDKALPLIEYKIEMAKKNINFNNPHHIAKYAEKVINITTPLEPVERDLYIKKLAEETNIKIQTLYDQLNDKIKKSGENSEKMNRLASFGQKLYLEPAYITAERLVLQVMFNNKDVYDNIINNLKEEELALESHKKIYKYITENIECEDIEKRKIQIEAKCDKQEETSKEWIKILDTEFMYDEEKIEEIIKDSIKSIKKYQLEKDKKELMDKIKQLEKEGKYKESIDISQKLVKLQKTIANM
ncbi:DNA primase [Clostridium niameyense]|uniref:DNA primase n=1 Tax=Clostridium niameyense TaxID=1622073 RepID=UPI00067E8787|nr:DNA primase [Clostridium niameyense]